MQVATLNNIFYKSIILIWGSSFCALLNMKSFLFMNQWCKKFKSLFPVCRFFFEMPTNHAQINCLLNGTPGPKLSLNKALLSKDWPLIYHTPFFVRILCWRNEDWIGRWYAGSQMLNSEIYNSMIQVSDILQYYWTSEQSIFNYHFNNNKNISI